jgi:hypothetical protein
LSPVQLTKPVGDNAVVTFRPGGKATVELLAVTDSSLFFVHHAAVTRAALADVSQVSVEGYGANEGYGARTGKWVALGCISLVNAAFCVDVIFHWAWYFALAAVPFWVAGTRLVMRDATQLDFRPSMDESAIAQLALYCRYPQGLTDAQWQELLSFYSQDTFLSPGDEPRP